MWLDTKLFQPKEAEKMRTILCTFWRHFDANLNFSLLLAPSYLAGPQPFAWNPAIWVAYRHMVSLSHLVGFKESFVVIVRFIIS